MARARTLKTPENTANTMMSRPPADIYDPADVALWNATRAIIVKGAREHTLKNITVHLPKGAFIVFTGPSGSGKSSLAFDTIYAEGQRRYVESLSAYARQFLELMSKPDVDSIDGLCPAIAIEQKTIANNPRSTVGTVTEIYDYLRLLFAKVGTAYSPATGLPIQAQTRDQMINRITQLPTGTRFYITAPLARSEKGEFRKEFLDLRKRGFQRVKVNGIIYDLDQPPPLDKNKRHTISVVIDRLVVPVKDTAFHRAETPSTDSASPPKILHDITLELSHKHTLVTQDSGKAEHSHSGHTENNDHVPVAHGDIHQTYLAEQDPPSPWQAFYERVSASVETGLVLGKGIIVLESATSADSPTENKPCADLAKPLVMSSHFSCPVSGFTLEEIEPRLFSFNNPFGACATCAGIGLDPWSLELLDDPYHQDRTAGRWRGQSPAPRAPKMEEDDNAEALAQTFDRMPVCPDCQGFRLKPQALCIHTAGLHIGQVCALDLQGLNTWLDDILPSVTPQTRPIAERILKEIRTRVGFLLEVGLGYLTLARRSGTLSGGESQRIRLASQVGSGLTGVLYVLDEPSIGLHQRDNERLLKTLIRLRDLGNTVVVVEHDEDAMRMADYILDFGPAAGRFGGEICAQGPLPYLLQASHSITGAYLSGAKRITSPSPRRTGNGNALRVVDAYANNLQHITVNFPLGTFIAITGVSGSGKSSLIMDTLRQALTDLSGRLPTHVACTRVEGIEYIDKMVSIDQSPIGRTPRSNPATYTGVFTPIREWYAFLPEAKARGYGPGRFSFNVKGGRCEACQGDGTLTIQMHFLPDMRVPCQACHGRRYSQDTLAITHRGKSIADVLDMSIEQAATFFEPIPSIAKRLQVLNSVGLGYLQVGQSATTLSGGEAQRVKLAKELARRSTGKTVYILDEPTTGLHFQDVQDLLNVLHRLVDQGNTVIVIEHNLELVKTADWVIDIGPEGGRAGGQLVAEGPPEVIATHPRSVTGPYLAPLLRP